jgi:hypothetical protein
VIFAAGSTICFSRLLLCFCGNTMLQAQMIIAVCDGQASECGLEALSSCSLIFTLQMTAAIAITQLMVRASSNCQR